jgi:hypothetical protein
MPRWIVVCPKCKRSVKFSKTTFAIGDHQRTEVGAKPPIQPSGVTAGCPYCKRSSTLRSCDLINELRVTTLRRLFN